MENDAASMDASELSKFLADVSCPEFKQTIKSGVGKEFQIKLASKSRVESVVLHSVTGL